MIGIISAMQEEIQALLVEIRNLKTSVKGMRTYYSGDLFDKKVVLVFSRWGKVASSATTTQLINDYNVDEIIFTGVAGAIKNDLNIGDIVIGKNLVQHDMDATPLFDQFEIPLLNKKYFETSNSLKLEEASNQFINNYTEYINTEQSREFGIEIPKVIVGDIASGDEFISDNSRIQQMNRELPSAVCVEMEGAAVAQVCYEYQVPFSVIRIISDKADYKATIDFPKFVSSVASHYAFGILKNYFV